MSSSNLSLSLLSNPLKDIHMNNKAWAKIFGIMSIPVIINVLFLFSNFSDWMFITNIAVLICSFLLFIIARVCEMKGVDVALIIIANIITLILNLLCWLKVL